jgi:hypothetical protein
MFDNWFIYIPLDVSICRDHLSGGLEIWNYLLFTDHLMMISADWNMQWDINKLNINIFIGFIINCCADDSQIYIQYMIHNMMQKI